MLAGYQKAAELVVECLPSVAAEECFALKGGTAINLFELDLPRLSVDIDLTYAKMTDRETAVREINAALLRIAERIRRKGIRVRISGTDVSRKLFCCGEDADIKIEPNFILRGILFPMRKLPLAKRMAALAGASVEISVLSREELYGGKFCAALDRQHPRDLFDVAQFFAHGGTVAEVKTGFLALALGHNRPFRELLHPNLLDQRKTFDRQFAGMSDQPFSYEEHEETFRRLVNGINDSLTAADRTNIAAFSALEADADVFGVPGLSELPAIEWKRRNLLTLRETNRVKFAAEVKSLHVALDE